MKHNILNIQFLFHFLLIFNTLNFQVFANEQGLNCGSFLKTNISTLENPSVDDSLTKSATFLGEDGQLYISKEAFVHGYQLINSQKFKAPVLKAQQSILGATDNFIIIENLLHNGQYCTAKFSLSPEAVNSTYVQTMPFPIVPGVMAGHVQARFVMSSGYEIELLDPVTLQTIDKVKDVIISYEAALPKGASYNFALGSVDSSPLVGRVVSGSQKLAEGPDRIFNQYKLPLNGSEASELLGIYLRNAIQIQMKFYYNTIVRNCTTTIFDGIDSLNRFKASIEAKTLVPFLTTIGGDPVIGPAINSLLDRFGSELQHVQDMKDEYQNIFQSYGVPIRQQTESLPFAPGGKHPMSLLVLTYGTENLTPEEKMIVDYMVEDIINDLPETFNMLLSSAFSLVEDLQTSPKIIKALTDVIALKLKSRLAQLGSSLPNKPITLQVQFTPYPSDTKGTDLRPNGVRAQLPFQIQKLNVLPSNRAEIFNLIQQGLNEVDGVVQEATPAFLKNFAVTIKLNKTEPRVISQFLMGLQPTLQNIEITNEQVALSQFAIPETSELRKSYWSRFKQAISPWAKEVKPPYVNMLLSHEQNLADAVPNPLAQIKFGPEAQISTSGQLVMNPVAAGKYICWSGAAPYTPQLTGTLAEAPLGQSNWLMRQFNKLLKDRPVTLSIAELEMNLEEINIKTTKLRVGVLGLRCLDIESVNQQFGAQANDKLQELIGKVGPGFVLP